MMREFELCKPCYLEERAKGRRLEVVRVGKNQKITCAVCGRRRYGAAYKEGNHEGTSR